MVLNVTFNNISVISWRSVLLVEETEAPGDGQKIDLNVSCDDTISELKAKISKETGIPIDEIHRYFCL
jgi:hypothetical protein